MDGLGKSLCDDSRADLAKDAVNQGEGRDCCFVSRAKQEDGE